MDYKIIKCFLFVILISLICNRTLAQTNKVYYQDGYDTLFTNGIFHVHIGARPGDNPPYLPCIVSEGVWHFESEKDSLVRLNSFFECQTKMLNAIEYVDSSISGYFLEEVYSTDGHLILFKKFEIEEFLFFQKPNGTLAFPPMLFVPSYEVKNSQSNHFVFVYQIAKDYPDAHYFDNVTVKLTKSGIYGDLIKKYFNDKRYN